MKKLILVCLIVFSNLLFSQNSLKVETPIIMSKLNIGKCLKFDRVKIKFVKVLQDSRCPKGVNCVWAGEVTVLIDIYQKGKKKESKKLTLNSKISKKDRFGNLFSSDELIISMINLLPLPVSGEKTDTKVYYLQLEVKS